MWISYQETSWIRRAYFKEGPYQTKNIDCPYNNDNRRRRKSASPCKKSWLCPWWELRLGGLNSSGFILLRWISIETMRIEKREVEVLDFEIVLEFELFYLFYKLRFYIGFINKLSSLYCSKSKDRKSVV